MKGRSRQGKQALGRQAHLEVAAGQGLRRLSPQALGHSRPRKHHGRQPAEPDDGLQAVEERTVTLSHGAPPPGAYGFDRMAGTSFPPPGRLPRPAGFPCGRTELQWF